MSIRVVQTTPPSVEPIGLSLAACKQWLKVQYTEEDDLISALAIAARQYGETVTHQNWVTQTWDMFCDSFGEICRSRDNTNIGLFPAVFSGQIYPLRGQPLQSVQFLKYLTSATGNYIEWDAHLYVCSQGLPGRISPVFGQPFPILSIYGPDAIWLRTTSGWDDTGSTLPSPWITACKMLVNHWYENRIAVADTTKVEVPLTIDALFSCYGGDYGLWW